MKLRRSLSVLALFLMMNGSLLGSEPEKRRQARWGELGKLIGGKKVALQLAEGARVEGRVGKVEATSLTIKVKKTSNPAAYPKGETEIPREAVSRIEARKPIVRPSNRIGLTVGALAGTFIGSGVAVKSTASDSGMTVAEGVAIVAIPTAVAVLVYRALRPKGVTLLIVPDFPGESEPNPRNNNQSPSPKQDASSSVGESLPVTSQPLILPAFKHNGIGAGIPSLVEQSSPERLRQQARRAVMRQGTPLHLSGLSERPPSVARYADD